MGFIDTSLTKNIMSERKDHGVSSDQEYEAMSQFVGPSESDGSHQCNDNPFHQKFPSPLESLSSSITLPSRLLYVQPSFSDVTSVLTYYTDGTYQRNSIENAKTV